MELRPRCRRSLPTLAVVFLAFLSGAAGRLLPLEAISEENTSCAPLQLHVAYTGDPTELKISWKTKGAGCLSHVDLWQSTAGNDGGLVALLRGLGRIAKFDSSDFCGSPARDYDSETQYVHHATLQGLQPGERYLYRVAGSDEKVSFRAPKPLGPESSFTFLAYGDMGESEHAEAKAPGAEDTMSLVRREVEDGAELILHVGDISYANGRSKIWDRFMEGIEPFASRVPYMVAIGNHEYDYHRLAGSKRDPSGAEEPYSPEWGNFGNDSGGECGVATTNLFAMPDVAEVAYWPHSNCSAGGVGAGALGCENGWPGPRNPTLGPDGAAASAGRAAPAGAGAAAAPKAKPAGNKSHHKPNPPFWYSFSYGSVHFVFISTEHDVTPGSKQYRWLKHDLKRVDRCKTPWLVVAMHRPMYVVLPHKSNRIVGDHLRDTLEDLFNQYEVDLVINGHVHSYSRTCNVLNWRCVDEEAEGGMTHVTVGCAGRKLSEMEYEQPEWLEYAESRFGYGRVTVRDGRSLTFEYVRTDDGRVHDSVTLCNKREGRRGCNNDAFLRSAAPAADGGQSGGAGASGSSSSDGREGGTAGAALSASSSTSSSCCSDSSGEGRCPNGSSGPGMLSMRSAAKGSVQSAVAELVAAV